MTTNTTTTTRIDWTAPATELYDDLVEQYMNTHRGDPDDLFADAEAWAMAQIARNAR